MVRVNDEEKRWRAESDARTLAEAEAIKQDTSRKKAAARAAKAMVEKEEIEARALKKIARMDNVKKKRTIKRKSK
jgi:hypothetical protein